MAFMNEPNECLSQGIVGFDQLGTLIEPDKVSKELAELPA